MVKLDEENNVNFFFRIRKREIINKYNLLFFVRCFLRFIEYVFFK